MEEWARKLIEIELGVDVVLHDDGSAPGLYDLRCGPIDAPAIAIECTGAVDPLWTETWNVGPARGPYYYDLSSDWTIAIEPGTRIKSLKDVLTPHLRNFEKLFESREEINNHLTRGYGNSYEELTALGVYTAYCHAMPGEGRVSLTMEGEGGATDNSGKGLVDWLEKFLVCPARADVLEKLGRSGAVKREVFIIMALKGAPWSASSYFSAEDRETPPVPELPPVVDGVWLIGPFSRTGVRWRDGVWAQFDLLT